MLKYAILTQGHSKKWGGTYFAFSPDQNRPDARSPYRYTVDPFPTNRIDISMYES